MRNLPILAYVFIISMLSVLNSAAEEAGSEKRKPTGVSSALPSIAEATEEESETDRFRTDTGRSCHEFLAQKAKELTESGYENILELAENLIHNMAMAEMNWELESKLLFKPTTESIEERLAKTAQKWRESEVKLHKDDAKSLGQIEALANAAKEFLEPTFK